MDAVLPLIPAATVAGLVFAKLRLGKPLSWPMVLAPLVLYALPLLLALAITGGILYAIVRRLPGGKVAMGGVAALLAGGAIWVRKLFKALK